MCYKHRREDWKNRQARKVHTTPANDYIPAKISSQTDCADQADETVGGSSNKNARKVEPSEAIIEPTSHHEDKSPTVLPPVDEPRPPSYNDIFKV